LKIDFDKPTPQIAQMTSKQHQQQETNRKKSIENSNHLGIFNLATLNLPLYELFYAKSSFQWSTDTVIVAVEAKVDDVFSYYAGSSNNEAFFVLSFDLDKLAQLDADLVSLIKQSS